MHFQNFAAHQSAAAHWLRITVLDARWWCLQSRHWPSSLLTMRHWFSNHNHHHHQYDAKKKERNHVIKWFDCPHHFYHDRFVDGCCIIRLWKQQKKYSINLVNRLNNNNEKKSFSPLHMDRLQFANQPSIHCHGW